MPSLRLLQQPSAGVLADFSCCRVAQVRHAVGAECARHVTEVLRADAPVCLAQQGATANQIPAESGDATPAQYPGAAAGCGMDVSSLNLPPAVVTPRPGGFLQEGAGRSCQWPLWGDRERPTGMFCGAAVRRRPDGVACVYCAQHAARAYDRRAPAGMPPAAALGGWRGAA